MGKPTLGRSENLHCVISVPYESFMCPTSVFSLIPCPECLGKMVVQEVHMVEFGKSLMICFVLQLYRTFDQLSNLLMQGSVICAKSFGYNLSIER